jgi:hypothetical protein
VPNFFACDLKKSTLSRLRLIVTLTVSSFNASSSGGGKKSSTGLPGLIGSSAYLILLFINPLTPAPISSTDDSNNVIAIGKSHCQYLPVNLTYTKIPGLIPAMFKIGNDNAE